MIAKPTRRARAERRASLAAARASGCTCQPDITRVGDSHGAPRLIVAHDDWCPLLHADEGSSSTDRRQAVLYRPEAFGA